MTKKDKKLLLTDLGVRLPYGVMCECRHSAATWPIAINTEDMTVCYFGSNIWEPVKYCIPYLRPMSSMTEEEHKEYFEKWGLDGWNIDTFDWLNTHHFDYRGLIEKGLAKEVTKDNNPYK